MICNMFEQNKCVYNTSMCIHIIVLIHYKLSYLKVLLKKSFVMSDVFLLIYQ